MKSIIPAAAINQHVAILGKTGSGKTFAAKGIVETQVLAPKCQLCVLDPTGAWYGLRLGRDGKTRGYDVIIIGGEHGDIPLAPRSGAAVARLVTEQLASVVIDTSGLLVGEYTRWFIDFAGTLFASIRSSLHLVIDEAHHFMPQGKVPDPDTGKMLHSGNRLMSGGRSRGIRAMLITQRPAKLHKDSLSCADTLIAMRVMAPQDRAAIKDWIDGAADPKAGREVLDSLANLKRGEGWVWYPEGAYLQRTAFPAITTYDSSATPDARTATPKLGEIDLSAVKAAMADAIAEAEANDPKALRRRIAELERQVREKPAAQADPAAVDRAVAVRDEHWRSVVETQTRRLKGIIAETESITKAVAHIAEMAETNRAELGAAEIVGTQQRPTVKKPAPIIPKDIPAKADPQTSGYIDVIRRARDPGGASLSTLERSLLTVLAQHPKGLTKTAACVMAGYRPSGDVSTAWSRFSESGWTSRTAEGLRIEPAGIEALGGYDPLPTGEDLREMWLSKLEKHEAALLRVLFERYPEGAPKTEIVEAAGYRPSGDISTAWGKFDLLGFTQRTANGVRASDMWFQ